MHTARGWLPDASISCRCYRGYMSAGRVCLCCILARSLLMAPACNLTCQWYCHVIASQQLCSRVVANLINAGQDTSAYAFSMDMQLGMGHQIWPGFLFTAQSASSTVNPSCHRRAASPYQGNRTLLPYCNQTQTTRRAGGPGGCC